MSRKNLDHDEYFFIFSTFYSVTFQGLQKAGFFGSTRSGIPGLGPVSGVRAGFRLKNLKIRVSGRVSG